MPAAEASLEIAWLQKQEKKNRHGGREQARGVGKRLAWFIMFMPEDVSVLVVYGCFLSFVFVSHCARLEELGCFVKPPGWE